VSELRKGRIGSAFRLGHPRITGVIPARSGRDSMRVSVRLRR
jgi:hypothetical protein